MVMYKFAYNQHQKIIDICEANRYEEYTCIGCGARLTPRKGSKNTHHFSHFVKGSNTKQNINCSPEHYIHKMAKELFFTSYKNKGPFFLIKEVEHKCTNKMAMQKCYKIKTETLDLLTSYQNIDIEKKDGDFIPDILLSGSDEQKLYIEFAYTHNSSKKKITSGNKIVEITIQSENDIKEIIDERTIDATKKNVTLYGFSKQSFDCHGSCEFEIPKKVQYKQINPTLNEEIIESYYKNGSYKFLLKKIISEPLPPKNFEYYRYYIPVLKSIRYELYLNKEFLGESSTEDAAKEMADTYVKKHTPPTLFD